MSSTRIVVRPLLAIWSLTACYYSTSPARAGDFVWAGTASGNFSGTGNWLGGAVPPRTDPTTTLTFTVSGTTAITATNDIGSPFEASAITFNTTLGNQSAGFAVGGSNGGDRFRLGGLATILQNGSGPAAFLAMGGNIELAANATVGGMGLGNLNIGGAISEVGGSRSLTISGMPATQNSRVVVLGGTNTLTGGIILDGGNLQLAAGASGALGPAGSTFTVTANGGVLSTGDNLLGLTVSTIQLNGPLRFIGLKELALGTSTVLAGSGNLTVSSTAATGMPPTAMIVASNCPGYSGTVTVDRHDLPYVSDPPGAFWITGDGALLNVPAFNIRAGGYLHLNDNYVGAPVSSSRVNATAPINLRSGGLILEGNGSGGAASAEKTGPVIGAGYSGVGAGPGSGGGLTTLTAASLARAERGTFVFTGRSLGSSATTNVGRIMFTTAPTGMVGTVDPVGAPANTTNLRILPYAIADPANGGASTIVTLATYDVNGIRALNTSTEFSAGFGASDSNVRLATSTTNNATVTVNSLSLAISASLTGTGTVNVNSGAVLASNSNSNSISNTIAFGGAEGNIFATVPLTISGNLTGTAGLTKSGGSDLVLTGINTGLTGLVTINGGRLTVDASPALPGTGQIVVNGTGGGSGLAGITYTGTAALAINRDVAVNTGWFNLQATGAAAGPLTFAGVISGVGGLYLETTGEIALTGVNTFTGPVRVQTGTLRISSDANLGNGGAVTFTAGGSITLDGDWTTGRPVNTSSPTLRFNTQGFNATLNGALTNVPPTLGASFGTLLKTGTGRLQINAPGTINGYDVVLASQGGEVRLARSGSLLTTSYILNTGTTLTADNTVLPGGSPTGPVTTDRICDAASVSLSSGGTLQYIGNATQATSETVGLVTVSGSGNVIRAVSSGGVAAVLQVGSPSAGSTAVSAGTSPVTFDGSGDIRVGMPITGTTATVTKTGTGRLLLNGVNTYTGLTTVSAGTLGGTGTITGPLTIAEGAFLAPGDSFGALSANGQVTLNGNYAFEAGDLLVVGPSGSLTLGPASSLIATGLDGTTTYTVASFPSGTLSGTFPSVIAPNYNIHYNSSTIQLIPVPEPSPMLLVGIVGFAVSRLRRKPRVCRSS